MQRKKFKNIEGKIIGGRKHYATRDVLHLFDLETERFRKWIDKPFIDKPFIEPAIRARGTGTTHFFRRYHLYTIGLFMQLVDNGLKREEASNLGILIDQKKWEQIRNQKKDCYVFITPDTRIKYEITPNGKIPVYNRQMLLHFIPGTTLDLSKFSKYTDLNVAWVMNLYKIIDYVDSNLIE